MAKKIKISEEEIEQINNEGKTRKKNGNLKYGLGVSIVFNILLIIAFIVVASNCNERIKELEDENSNLISDSVGYEIKANQLDELLGDKTYYYVKEKLDSYDRDIIFQVKGKGKYYYSYDCVQKIVDGSYEFWAYNKEQAKDLGLKKGSCN